MKTAMTMRLYQANNFAIRKELLDGGELLVALRVGGAAALVRRQRRACAGRERRHRMREHAARDRAVVALGWAWVALPPDFARRRSTLARNAAMLVHWASLSAHSRVWANGSAGANQ